MFCPGAVFAGIDATGFETIHAASYYVWRTDFRRQYTKMSACSDTGTQLVMAVAVGRGPAADVSHVPELLRKMRRSAPAHTVVMDRGYDAEWVHEAVRDAGARAVIPVRRQEPGFRTRGRHRKQMRVAFESGSILEVYSQRSKTETVFSVIKRLFGSSVSSRSARAREIELLYRVLACNCRRMCVISCVVFLMISMQPEIKKLFNHVMHTSSVFGTLSTVILTVSVALVMASGGTGTVLGDHTDNTATWQTDMTFDIHSTLNHVSHASFTPATDFEDSADVWNNVASSWWDFTRDDSDGDIDIKSRGMGWFTSILAITNAIQSDGTMSWAQVAFNSDKDFRDARTSTGWLSYDYETVAIHEIGHVAGIRHHTSTSGSPMVSYIPANHIDRTLNPHDISTIGGMY